MTKNIHSQTAGGNPTNSRFSLKRKFLGNILIMSTLLTTFVPLPADAYYNQTDSGYKDIGYDTWSNNNLIKDSYKEDSYKDNKKNQKKTPSTSSTLKNDRGNTSVSNSGVSNLFILALGAVFLYFWPSKNKNTTKSTVCQRQQQNNELYYNNWETLYGDHVINTEPKIDFYTKPVIKLGKEKPHMNSYTKAENNLEGNNNLHGGKKKNINLYNKPDPDFCANYPYPPRNYYAQQNMGVGGPLLYQGAGVNGYPYNMNNPLLYQGTEGNEYYTRPNKGGGNSLFGNDTKDNGSTYNTRISLFGDDAKDNDSTYNTGRSLFGNDRKDNDYESSTESGTRGNQRPPVVAKENLLRMQKEQDGFFKNLIQSLEKNKNGILNSIEDLNNYLDSLCDIIKVAKEKPDSNKLMSDLPGISEKFKQVEESFNDICGIIETGLSKSGTFLTHPVLLEKLNSIKCTQQKKGHDAIENIYQIFNLILNDKMDCQNNEKALEYDLAECVQAFEKLSDALRSLNMVNNALLDSVSKYYRELR